MRGIEKKTGDKTMLAFGGVRNRGILCRWRNLDEGRQEYKALIDPDNVASTCVEKRTIIVWENIAVWR